MKKKKKKKSRKFIKYTFLTIFLIILFTSVALAGIVLAMIKTAPQLDVNSILNLNQPSVLYDNKGNLMDEAPTDLKRETVALKDVPDNLKNAFISIEDERFYQHHGIDPKRIVGSALIDVERIFKSQSGLNGASTLTQQLIKNTVLSNEVTPKRKIQEMYLSTELEKALSKDQILEAYLNTINLGGNIYGVQKAAKQYFSKDVKDLNLIQCAYIAGVTQNPSKYSVLLNYAKKNPSDYINRTKTVLAKMKELGHIDEKAYESAIADINAGKLNPNTFQFPKSETANKLNYEWFSRPAMDQVKADLISQYNYSDEEVQKLLMYGGLKIYTTMDRSLQDNVQNIINDNKNYNGVSTGDLNDPKNVVQPQASAVIMDYRTGEVRVIIGGRGNQPANSYNRAASTSYIRPTGSSIKPITVYSPAIDTKQATAATIIEDSPLSPDIGKQWPNADGSPYNPSNYDTEGFMGNVTIREALRRSINLVAIKLEYQIGLKTGASYAEKFGIHFSKTEAQSLSALSLGQFEGSNTLQMSAAFGTFANGGTYTTPKLYTKVVDKTGKVLLENKTTTRKILSPQSAYIMYDLLKGPTSSLPGATASSAKFSDMPAAGKTGTSSNKKDFWFCGVTPYYSGAVWIGNDRKTPYTGVSSYTSATIWGKIMSVAHQGLQVKDIDVPDGIKQVSVSGKTGKLSDAATDPNAYAEWFIDGTEPTQIDDSASTDTNKIPFSVSYNSTYTPAIVAQSAND
ncbi:PBP1A family penicillin-binding protein [Clostridium sp. 19966]|uniref:transglycosylase domain-containing protein n=1 Tax=Clostridium sp. 19966 TaxID=2768166 RepID=UPI0028DDFB19|nr:PBP1A family penicillin-binding protein [Clostridium sp. 19966]MDT8717455.1 PBP1A family penicillin-binding protein [Clostridium sp. 19966]